MSHYQDDVTDLLWVSDNTWGGQAALLADVISVRENAAGGSIEGLDDALYLLDDGVGSLGAATGDNGVLAAVLLSRHAALRVQGDILRMHASTTAVLTATHADALHLTDDSGVGYRVVIDERLVFDATFFGVKATRISLDDSLLVTDTSGAVFSTIISDTLGISEYWWSHLAAGAVVTDDMGLGEVMREQLGHGDELLDTLRVTDSVGGTLHARTLTDDELFMQDSAPSGVVGEAWVSEVDKWAMSRYAPYNFESVAVVNGVPYGAAAGGLFNLDTPGERISSRLTTGVRDVGGQPLTLPAYAYAGYIMDGGMTMQVSQTQAGALESWSYPFDSPPTPVVKNGRFVFGRGLRGRYFAFDLVCEGATWVLDDLYLVLANKKRRI